MPNGIYQFRLVHQSTPAAFESNIGEEDTFVFGDSFWSGCGTGIGTMARRRAIDQANHGRACGLGGCILTIVQL